MKHRILSSALALSLFPLLMGSPYASADFIQKQVACPKNNVVVLPAGGRFDVEDIIVSTTKDQNVTIKFSPSNRILMRIYMKGRTSFSTNFSGEVDSEEEGGLKLDCAGTAGTTVSVSIIGNGNL
jgi:hypothetical protein